MVFQLLWDAYTYYTAGIKLYPDRNIVDVVEKCDLVIFDFSAWSPDDLNPDSTVKGGIPLGEMVLETWFSTQKLRGDPAWPASVKDVIAVYKWCREQAPKSTNAERVFRFENNEFHSCH